MGGAGRVLVADDSATVRALVRLVLDEAGYEVLEAPDGRAALEHLAREHVDAVLLDVEMPVLDGYATVVAMKRDPRTADVPVVFLTGRVTAEDVARALRLGGHDHLRKPPDPVELLARVASAVRVGALQEELRQRVEELDRLSRTDDLTGLFNRRHVEEQLGRLASAARRHRHRLSVLMLDIDHFKRVNDTAGHAAGDLVLQAVAQVMREGVRAEDVVGRWGGEELLVVLPHAGPEQAAEVAERLRAEVAALVVPTRSGPVQVTVSVGGAGVAGDGEHDLLALADRLLYRAKQEGRDRVLVARSPGGELVDPPAPDAVPAVTDRAPAPRAPLAPPSRGVVAPDGG